MWLLFDVILTFCIIFGFSLQGGGGIDSTVAVAAYLLLYSMFCSSYRNKVLMFFCTGYFKKITIIYGIINYWILITTTLNSSNDYSYMKTFLHMYFIVVVCFLFYLYLENKGKACEVIRFIIIAYAIQSVIEWGGFLVPEFREMIQTTKTEASIKKAMEYSGVRGNALCGSDFFGLSAAFALSYIVFLSSNNVLFANNRVAKLSVFFLVLTGTFFAGRTGYVGLIVVVYHVFTHRNQIFARKKLNKTEMISLALFFLGFVSLISYMVQLFYTDESFRLLFEWTFQNLFAYAETGSMQTSSTSHLSDDMYYMVGLKTFLFGDGKYTLSNGLYYGHTDSGYMRVILYMGIVGFFLLFYMMLSILKPQLGKDKALNYSVIFLLLILNYKGEVITWNSVTLATFTLYSIQNIRI